LNTASCPGPINPTLGEAIKGTQAFSNFASCSCDRKGSLGYKGKKLF